MSFQGLPNEVWGVVLKFAFIDIEKSLETLKTSLVVRATSWQLMKFIDTYVLLGMKCLDMDDCARIPAHLLPLFKGICYLEQLALPQINDATLCLMPWVNHLWIRNDKDDYYADHSDDDDDYSSKECSLLTANGIICLTNLERLSIHEANINQASCLSTLKSLKELDLWFNTAVNDKELGDLFTVTRLCLWEDRKITGECFTQNKMPLLKHLIIGGNSSNLSRNAIEYIAPRLETLHVWECKVIKAPQLEQMINLKELHLMRTENHQYNDAIAKLTSLTSIQLWSMDILDWALCELKQLTTLNLSHCDLITPSTLVYLSNTLIEAQIAYCPHILAQDLLCCTKLKSFSYTRMGEASPSDLQAFRTLAVRGVEWVGEEYDDCAWRLYFLFLPRG